MIENHDEKESIERNQRRRINRREIQRERINRKKIQREKVNKEN